MMFIIHFFFIISNKKDIFFYVRIINLVVKPQLSKFKDNSGLQHWADIQNLKIAASSYRSAGTITALQDKLQATTATAKAARESIVRVEHQMKDLAEIIKYAEQYQDNKKYNFRYKKSKDPDTYFRSHETESGIVPCRYKLICNKNIFVVIFSTSSRAFSNPNF